MELRNDIIHYNRLGVREKVYLAAFLIAVSGIMSVIDGFLPKPIPLMKLGIANCVTLVLIHYGQYRLSFTIAFWRTLLSALMVGTLLSYTFLFSISGALVSTLAMVIFHRFFKNKLSMIGISIIGAFFSTMGQGICVALLFGLDKGMVLLISIFGCLSVANGLVIGLTGRYIVQKMEKTTSSSSLPQSEEPLPPPQLR